MSDFDPDACLRLTRYLAGDCTPAEAVELEAWLAADPARQRELDALRLLWDASAGLPAPDRINEMWSDVARHIRGAASPDVTATASAPPPILTLHRFESRRSSAWTRWGLGLAAAASVALAVAYGVREQSRSVAAPVRIAEAKEYRTVRGQRATIQLGDGTRIELGVASVLRVHPFAGGRRDVELDGEAVFDVVHDPTRPFSVRSGGALVEDLGTRFGIRGYRGDGHVRVVVASGKVALHPSATRADTRAVLLPGDLAIVDHAGRSQVRHGIAAERYFGWIAGRLVFQNATLADVAADLERWYDVEIAFATPSIMTRRVTVSMPVSSLTDALDAVTAPLGLAYARHGTAVSLYPR